MISQYNAAYEEERKQRAKQARLEEHEAALEARRTAAATKGEKAEASDFATKLGTSILANLQLSLTNVHIRYEDPLTEPGRTLAIGVTIAKITVGTTGPDWQPMFVKKPGDTIFKVLGLEALAVYWSMDSVLLGKLPQAELNAAMQALIATKADPAPTYRHAPSKRDVRNQYLLKPVSAACRLRLNTVLTATPGIPKMDAQLTIENLDVELLRRQYHQAMLLVGVFAAMVKAEPYRPLHPPLGVTAKAQPRVWWAFAIAAVLADVRERRASWTWKRFAQRRDERHAYVRLYQLVLKDKETKTTKAELALLERKLSFEDIRLYRHAASSIVRRERAAKAKGGKPATKEAKKEATKEAKKEATKEAKDGKPGQLTVPDAAPTPVPPAGPAPAPPSAAATPADGKSLPTLPGASTAASEAAPALAAPVPMSPGKAGAGAAAATTAEAVAGDTAEPAKKKGMPSWLEKMMHKTKKTAPPATATASATPAASAAPAAATAAPAGTPAATPTPATSKGSAIAATPTPAPASTPAPTAAAPPAFVPLDIEEELVATAPFPPSYIWLVLDISLARVSVSLRGDQQLAPRSSAGSAEALAAAAVDAAVYSRVLLLSLENFALKLAQRPVTTTLNASLQTLVITDTAGIFMGPKAPALAAAAAPPSTAAPPLSAAPPSTAPLTAASTAADASKRPPPLFVMDYEHAPLDGRADEVIHVVLQPLEIHYNKATVDQVIHFATPPVDASSLNFLREALTHQMQALHQLSRASLEYLINQHKVRGVASC